MTSLLTPLRGALCCALFPFVVPPTSAATPWHPVPIRDTAYPAPLLGGEGGQVITAFAVESGPNPDSFFMSTNTGGIYRSTDGVTWEKCNVGLTGQGGYAFAIDPKNDQRVLVAYGSDNNTGTPIGVAFSSNRGASWTRSPAPNFSPAHTSNVVIPRERRSLAWDSKSGTSTASTRAFFSSRVDGLYRSTNSGATWTRIPSANTIAHHSLAHVVFDPDVGTKGRLYVAGAGGFHYTDNPDAATPTFVSHPPLPATPGVHGFDLLPDGTVVVTAANKRLFTHSRAGLTALAPWTEIAVTNGFSPDADDRLTQVSVNPGQPGTILLNVHTDALASDPKFFNQKLIRTHAAGDRLALTGNTWRKFTFPVPYTVTANTKLEVTVQGSDVGELIGVALDEDDTYGNARRVFLLGGSQGSDPAWYAGQTSWCTQVTPFYTAGAAAQIYTIHIGATFTGEVNHLAFIADDDANASTNVTFSGVRLYEGTNRPALPLGFAAWSHTPYGGEDVSAGLTVSAGTSNPPLWADVTFDTSLSFIPRYNREQRPVWFRDSTVVGGWRALGEGGDYVTFSPPLGASSTPGSAFGWASDGYLGIMPAGGFSFSRFAPSILALSFQDYKVAETSGALDATAANPPLWTAHNNFPTSNAYAAIMPDPRRIIALRGGWEPPHSVTVGTRSGASGPFAWTSHALAITGDRASFIDPGYDAATNEVVFVGNWRCSGDPAIAANWTNLASPDDNKVSNVLAADFVTGTLYGVYNYRFTEIVNGEEVVRVRYNLLTSTDRGVTWTPRLSAVNGNVRSLAYDHVAKKLWLIAQTNTDTQTNALFAATHTGTATAPVYSAPVALSTTTVLPRETAHKNETGTREIRPTVVEVDPFDPSIVYVGAARAFYRSDLHVIRSTNGGTNWTVLNPTPANPITATNVNGPEEITGIRVHPLTRDVWITGAMYGVWRIPAAVSATYWTDFGSLSNGAFPGGSGWTLFNNTTVLTPPSADFTIGTHPAGSGKGLAVAGAKRGLRRTFASVAGVVSWEFDVYLTAGSDTNRTLALGNSSAEAVRITTASGRFHYLDAAGAHVQLDSTPIANNTLYRFRVVADTVGQRADIYLDSGVGLRLRARQMPFRQIVTNLDRMTFFNGWNTPQTMWLDNLRVETRSPGGL